MAAKRQVEVLMILRILYNFVVVEKINDLEVIVVKHIKDCDARQNSITIWVNLGRGELGDVEEVLSYEIERKSSHW